MGCPAGLFSGLASHVISARVRFPRIVARLMENKLPEAAKPSTLSRVLRTRPATIEADAAPTVDRSMKILPSLGASGAIYASVSLTALAFPDAVISLIFPPTHPIPIQWGVGGLVLLDVVGLLRGWRCVRVPAQMGLLAHNFMYSLFDHAAHLAGAGFGVLYYYYGPALWDFMRALDAEMVEEGDDYHDGFVGSDGAEGSESVEG
jgi:rhomboid-like protein